jgi:hypothetical protein
MNPVAVGDPLLWVRRFMSVVDQSVRPEARHEGAQTGGEIVPRRRCRDCPSQSKLLA